MIESTTIKSVKNLATDPIQANRNKGNQSFRPQQFQNTTSKNPCHDGCHVSEKQLQTHSGKTETVNEANNITEQSSGVEKTSGGNCPGSNIIANILQELIQALTSTQVGR